MVVICFDMKLFKMPQIDKLLELFPDNMSIEKLSFICFEALNKIDMAMIKYMFCH